MGVTIFEVTISVFHICDENNLLLITIPGHWQTKSAERTINELYKLFELRSQNGIELHVKQVRKKGNQIKIGDNGYKLLDFDTQKSEILEQLENVKYKDLEDLVFGLQLTYDETVNISVIKYVPTKRTDYS